MNSSRVVEQDPVAELRQAFDRSFAEAPSVDGSAVYDLLDLRFGPARYALRVSELAALIADVRITPVSTPIPELLGIVAIRGAVLPVYDLGAILGHPAEPTLRWMAVAAGDAPVGLAFAQLEGHLRVRDGAVGAGGRSGASHVREVVHFETGVRSIVSIVSVLDAITSRVRAVSGKE